MIRYNLELETKEQFIADRLSEETKYPIFCRILESLKKFNGKDISKRIQTHLEKEFPEYRFNYCAEHSYYRLNVSEKGINNYKSILLLEYFISNNELVLNLTERIFNEYSPSYGIGVKERIEYWTPERKEQYIKMLENYHSKIAEMITMKETIRSFRKTF